MTESVKGNHATTDCVSERAHESVDRIAGAAGKGEERIRHEAADAEARVRDLGEMAREKSDEALRTVDIFVRSKVDARRRLFA
ncbi:MAG: hypothetical protein ABR612_06525 [Chromatocurvus sp.]